MTITHDPCNTSDTAEITCCVTVHTFSLGDVEDPDIWAADPLIEWQRSESGRWVMQHATETPVWHRSPDAFGRGYRYWITASFQGQTLTEWLLRHGCD